MSKKTFSYPARRANDGSIIVNERCSCGALRTEHEASFGGLAPGHGSCARTKCSKFTWVENVRIAAVERR